MRFYIVDYIPTLLINVKFQNKSIIKKLNDEQKFSSHYFPMIFQFTQKPKYYKPAIFTVWLSFMSLYII